MRLSLLGIALLSLFACGTNTSGVPDGESGTPDEASASATCPNTTQNTPADGTDEFTCGDWVIQLGDLMDIPTEIVLDANSFNEIPEPGGKYVALSVTATYRGEGSSDLGDVYSMFGPGGLVGSSAVRYEPSFVCCDSTDGLIGKQWSNTSAPFSGGTASGYLFFKVGAGDSDFVLGLDLDSYSEVQLWVAPVVSTEPFGGKNASYSSLADLKLAYLQSGGTCTDWFQSDAVDMAIASGQCADSSVILALYASREDIDANQQAAQELMSVLEDAGLDTADLLAPQLVGPNWVITSSNASLLQTNMGGEVIG